MKIVVCWLGLQGYAAACFRALDRTPSVDLHVIHLDFEDVPRQEELLDGVSNERFMASAPNPGIAESVARHRPDVVLLCGWFYPAYRALLDHPALTSTRFMLGMDTPWSGSLPQRVNVVRLRSFMRRMTKVIVAGARSAEFARRLDPTPGKVVTGLYGFDFDTFAQVGAAADREGDWPRRFLFAGRYVPIKGLDVLMAAYEQYRSRVTEPWPLDVCGAGPEEGLFKSRPGVHDLGYQLPSALPAIFASHGAFIMPSREEPWGVAIAEAAATGMPLICTDICGAVADLVRPYYNGLIVPAGDVPALADALIWLHEHPERLPIMGRRGRELAQAFAATAWADRIYEYSATSMRTGHPASPHA
jgi:glycosyltransferase involved in cell wall biosynthesis